jgi:uncharacterized protein (TIGR02246 family)
MNAEHNTSNDRDAMDTAARILRQLEAGWNAGDGDAFAAPFTVDADFVDVRGMHHKGRPAIAGGHTGIFASIYRGSTVQYAVHSARALSDDIILAHSSAELRVPSGPLAGEHRATQSLVIARVNDSWQVASFHNTPIAAPGGSPPSGPPGNR